MRGLALEVSEWLPTEEFPNKVAAVIADRTFPIETIVEAIQACPWDDVVWVFRDRDDVARQALADAGVDAIALPLNPHWEVKTKSPFVGPLPEGKRRGTETITYHDSRRQTREFEMHYGCTHVLVFRNPSSDVSKHWVDRPSARAVIHIVEPPKGAKKS